MFESTTGPTGGRSFQPGDEPPVPVRIAVSGAAGRVAYDLMFPIAAGGLFGLGRPVSLSLLDLPKRMQLLEATRLELQDCAFPLLSELRLSDDPAEAFADADWIVLLGGTGLAHNGMSRLDLIRENGPIYVEHGKAINHVAPTARILVVAEPCNTNCLIALKQATDIPEERWFALNRLDRMRATAMIAEKAGVPVARVNRVTVWGNHSEKIYVDFHNAFIDDRPAGQVITDRAWVRGVLEPTVARRERQIQKLRGATPAGTAVQAILGTIRSICTPTHLRGRFGAAVISDGSYGVPRELVFGFPLRTEDGQTWSIVDGLYLDEYAESRLAENVEELEHEAVVAGF
ncbi:MAG TPA: malate dehydrogenase [Pirellulales bacterium]|jgi:malate dehydrogenase|nr:malate dehydrogenase [Pirellulales bacterium]